MLPFVEQEALYNLQKGKSSSTSPTRTAAAAQMLATPLSLLHCPTRRRAMTYPHWGFQFKFADAVGRVAKSDYAANGGDRCAHPGILGIWPNHCYNAHCGPSSVPDDSSLAQLAQQVTDPSNPNRPTGIVHPLSSVSQAHIRDGASNTLLVGEKYVCPDYYFTGGDGGDNETMYIGDNEDITRWGGPSYPPTQDRPGYALRLTFGSAHTGSFNACLCDGSVRALSYSTDLEVLRRLANRMDGQAVDTSQF